VSLLTDLIPSFCLALDVVFGQPVATMLLSTFVYIRNLYS